MQGLRHPAGQTSSSVQDWLQPLPPEEPAAVALMPPLPPNDPNAPVAFMPPLPPEPQQMATFVQPPLPMETFYTSSPMKASPSRSFEPSGHWVMPPLPPTPPPPGPAIANALNLRPASQPPPLPPLPEVPLDMCLPASAAHLQAGVWPWVVFLPESFACMDLLYPNHA